MATKRSSAVKIPAFDKECYDLWKRKMLLYIKVANPRYLTVLSDGPLIPMVQEGEKMVQKDFAAFTPDEKDDFVLDDNLQLIIIDSLDKDMYNHVVNCVDAKHMWETIETINEGTDEVRENKMEILMVEYEHFEPHIKEGISEVFERYNKLINSLKLAGKVYSTKEINKKFLLALPEHLEHRVTAIRESRDIGSISLDKLYGILKTYELEQDQQTKMRSRRKGASTSAALYGKDSGKVEKPPRKMAAEINRSHSTDEDEITVVHGQTNRVEESDSKYYSLEELDQLEDESMAMVVRNFGKFRFKRNPDFKFKSQNRFQRGSYAPSSSMNSGYKTGNINRSKARCYNCNELGHFSSECKKPKQEKKSYSAPTNQKSRQGKAYVADEKTWDDTDDEEEETVNLALMAFALEPRVNPIDPRTKVPMTDSVFISNLMGTLSSAQTFSDRTALENTNLKNEVKELKTKWKCLAKEKVAGFCEVIAFI